MSYPAPYIDETGFHAPEYLEILDGLKELFREAFGLDVYLEPDSPDYQMLSAFAYKLDDEYRAMEMVFLGRSPHYAVGTGLDGIVAINGIARQKATYGSVSLLITGDVGTLIRKSVGVVKDAEGNRWQITDDFEIPQSGSGRMDATCLQPGMVRAPAGTLTIIEMPTQGWITVTNPEDANPGTPVEDDESLRARNAKSAALPARSVISGIQSAIEALSGVIQCIPFENDTNLTDDKGIPPHSLCAVVEGGANESIAKTIYLKKTPGSGTYGNTSVTIADVNGGEIDVGFSRPQAVPVFVEVSLKTALGYTDTDANNVKDGIAAYISDSEIGGMVIQSMLFSAAQNVYFSAGAKPPFTILSVRMGITSSNLSTENITVSYDQYATCSVSDITIITNEVGG